MTTIKERMLKATGSITGVASILGSWQVCHNICLGLIALLAVVGITLVGMPLLFLTKIALPLWIIAVTLLAITITMHVKMKCISKNQLLFNSGLVIIGVPFQPAGTSPIFWATGTIFILSAAALFMYGRNRRCHHDSKTDK